MSQSLGHDPLCIELYKQTISIPAERCVACHVIGMVREDMLAKCIKAVEALEPLLFVDKWHGGYDCCGCSTLDALHEDSINAMRALQEKP